MAGTHASFLEVGVDVIETNTFGAFAVPLSEYGIAHRAHEPLDALAAAALCDILETAAHRDAVPGDGHLSALSEAIQATIGEMKRLPGDTAMPPARAASEA